jgi:hypothetical protein
MQPCLSLASFIETAACNFFASGGQGDSFRENRPPGPPTKAFY